MFAVFEEIRDGINTLVELAYAGTSTKGADLNDTRDEGIALVKKYDGEFPKLYFKEILEYLNMSEEEFTETIDKFRPKHIWKKNGSEWELKNAVWK